MYDIEIYLPITNNGKYKRRFEEFKKYGLVNIGKYKVLVSLLVGTEQIEDACDGWNDQLTVRVIRAPVNHCAAKVYDFYINYDLNELNNAKWFMRVDDDSMTNITRLMDILSNYDHEDCYYICGPTMVADPNIDVEFPLVKKLNFNIRFPLQHEIEAALTSAKCLRKMLSNSNTRVLFQHRSKIEAGYTDICFAMGAELAGILPAAQVFFITHEADVFSFVLGTRAHIHFIAPDIDNGLKFNLVTKNRNYNFIDKKLIFGSSNNSNLFSRKLNAQGILEPSTYEETFWDYDEFNKKLIIFDMYFRIVKEFTINNCYPIPYTEGIYHNNPNEIPFIRSLFE